MLVDTPEGIVNTDHVVSARASGRIGDAGGTLVLVDGSTRSTRDIGLFEEACGVIVPAPPGFEVVTARLPAPDQEDILYSFEAVIAFRIGAGWGDAEPVPITISGRPDTLSHTIWTLRQPNGSCSGPDGPYDHLDAFMASCERMAQRLPAQPSHQDAQVRP